MNPEVDPRKDQPAAYDAEGRPLYYHADEPDQIDNQEKLENIDQNTQINTQQDGQKSQNLVGPDPQVQAVKIVQTVSEPKRLSPELQKRHEESVAQYPYLNLSSCEYIVIDVERSIWGIVQIWFFACVAALAVLAATVFMAQSSGGANQGAVVGLIASAACVAGGMVATHVYRQNYFVVSNERVFARIQFSPFARRSQNVELEHVEDCSVRQAGIVQTLLNYGSIRLSTVGDEHTYRFTFVSRPEEQFSIINKVVQAVDEGESTRYL